jgi:hypothetical protein
MMQTVLVYIILLGALGFIGFKLYKAFTKKKCDDKDCGCN